MINQSIFIYRVIKLYSRKVKTTDYGKEHSGQNNWTVAGHARW